MRVLLLMLGCGLAALLSGATCAATTASDIDRSQREVELAAALHQEGNQPGAIDRLGQALVLDDENARAYFLLGYIHMERRNFSQAETQLRLAVRLMVDLGERGSALAEARNVLGLCLMHLEQYDEAVEMLHESAIDLLNTAPHLAWGNLGLAHHESGNYEEALEAFRESIRRQPRFCLGYFRMGKTFFTMDNFTDAEEALTRAISADETCDSFQPAYRLRGEARARLQLRHEAIEDFERCVELGANTDAGETCQRYLEGGP